MKILVVSEFFNNGGLETQIKTYYDNLPAKVEMIFAFSKYTKKIVLDNAKIYSNFHFSYSDTIKDFCEDVENLIKIINEEKVDVIHVHPYYSFFAALFASQLTHTKIVYTYHGASSFNFLNATISSILFYYSLESNCIAKVFSVSSKGIKCLKDLGFENCSLLANPIDLKRFPIATIKDNRRWALISRIDEDKIGEIKQILLKMSDYNIESIDIYGDGGASNELKNFIEKQNLSKKVFIKGYITDIFNTVNNNYTGIIGIGRVAIESIAMGYPTLIIGFNKINGFINDKMFKILKCNNFVNRRLNMENKIFPTKKEQQKMTSKIRKEFDANKIVMDYISELKNCDNNFYKNIENLYHEIKLLSKNDLISNCYFHKERLVYNLLQKYIKNSCLKAETLNLFINANIAYEIYDTLEMRMSESKKN